MKKWKTSFPYKLNSKTVYWLEARRGRYISDIIPLRRAITTIYILYTFNSYTGAHRTGRTYVSATWRALAAL